MSQWPDYLHVLTITTIVLELLDYLCIAQEHNITLEKFWLLDQGIHADFSIIHNLIDEFLTFKGQLYVPKRLVPTIFYEYHNA